MFVNTLADEFAGLAAARVQLSAKVRADLEELRDKVSKVQAWLVARVERALNVRGFEKASVNSSQIPSREC